ncbi:hypothetical protein F5Y17DRAFT_342784 [Xylariaceae sp. FL0594]|nr:hypothetical protein F5Y17DRAFT_342784 [Xylariaceae sp. FL0594]
MALDVPARTPDRGPGLVALCILLMILSTVTTIGRITSKFLVKQYWWWDDLFAILSLPIQITLLGIILSWKNIGLGLHAETVASVNPLYLIKGAKHLYIAIFFFDSSISLPKLSALFFYARVFRSNNRIFKINLWIAGSLVVGWIVAALISTAFQCTPIEKAWNPLLPGHCINTYVWYLSTAALSVVIDVYILLLPVPMIWALKTSMRRRIYLLCAFFLTYSVIVISVGRLISTVSLIPTLTEDLTWNFPPYLYWACFEGSISLISISVPNLIGLAKAFLGSSWLGITEKGTAGSTSRKTPRFATSSAVNGLPTSMSRDPDRDGFERLVSSEGGSGWDGDARRPMGGVDNSNTSIPLDRIHVQTQISVSSGKADWNGLP